MIDSADSPELRAPDALTAVRAAQYPLPAYRNLDYEHVFLGRAFVQTTLPHSRPKANPFVRENGDVRVALVTSDPNGLPYGTIPRLILMWMCTQVGILKTRSFELPATFTGFLRLVGTSDGARAAANARRQLESLMKTTIDVSKVSTGPQLTLLAEDHLLSANRGFRISDEYQLWWNARRKEQCFAVTLSERFFEYARESQVPLNWNVVRALRSPLALDIYAWLVHRTLRSHRRAAMGAPAEFVSWDRLRFQFGAEYANRDRFAEKFRETLATVLQHHPVARINAVYGGLEIRTFAALPTSGSPATSLT